MESELSPAIFRVPGADNEVFSTDINGSFADDGSFRDRGGGKHSFPAGDGSDP